MSLAPPGYQQSVQTGIRQYLYFSKMFRSVQTVFKQLQHSLWEGPKALLETSLIFVEHSGTSSTNINILPNTCLDTCLTPWGGQGHSRDTLGDTPVVVFSFNRPSGSNHYLVSFLNRCYGQVGRLLGFLGGPRGFARVPHRLLAIWVWLSGQEHALWTECWTILMLC